MTTKRRIENLERNFKTSRAHRQSQQSTTPALLGNTYITIGTAFTTNCQPLHSPQPRGALTYSFLAVEPPIWRSASAKVCTKVYNGFVYFDLGDYLFAISCDDLFTVRVDIYSLCIVYCCWQFIAIFRHLSRKCPLISGN